jgi:hypothetical protein
MKIYVVAGTGEEARRWINSNIEKRAKIGMPYSLSDYVYVANADKLRGIRDPHGVFVGNWLGRPDIFDIVHQLMLSSIHINPALSKIYNDLKPQVRGKTATSILIDELTYVQQTHQNLQRA